MGFFTSAKTQNMPLRKFFFIALAMLLAASLSGIFASRPAFAEPTSAEKQAEADAVAAKLTQWEGELQTASNNYYTAMDAHDAAVEKMNEAQARIDAAEAIIADTQTKLGTRVNSMYRSGPLSFLDVLFGANSFEEFTTRWDVLNGINKGNAELISQNKSARAEAEAAHQEFTAQEAVAAEKLAEAEQIKAQAENTVAQYQAELGSLEAEVAALVQQEQQAEQARLAAEAAANGGTGGGGGGGGGGDYRGDGAGSYPVGTYNSIVEAAYSRIGCPYVWAGNGPDVFDCSGLTRWCYAQVGISIPRTDGGQYAAASSILPVSQAQPGDILWMPGHVGIALGGGAYIHAPVPGQSVRVDTWPMFTCALRY
jgi:cell wall-associated NlpC family hydrolase